MSQIKEKLYEFCFQTMQKRMEVCQDRIAKVQEDLKAETKSSAGDKHETARAMLQLEREKLGQQLVVIEQERAFLQSLNISIPYPTVRRGSLVKTNYANYFIATSAGEVKLNNKKYYAISAETPIGQLLMRKEVGDIVDFRGQKIEILEIQ